MDEDIFLEDRLWPWLAKDCMTDETYEAMPYEDGWEEPYYYCDGCGAGLTGEEEECPDCGLVFEG